MQGRNDDSPITLDSVLDGAFQASSYMRRRATRECTVSALQASGTKYER